MKHFVFDDSPMISDSSISFPKIDNDVFGIVYSTESNSTPHLCMVCDTEHLRAIYDSVMHLSKSDSKNS